VTPGDQAGTVTVNISAAGRHSEIEVTYQLTALTGPGGRKLGEFADRYPVYLQSWQDAINAWIQRRDQARPAQNLIAPPGAAAGAGSARSQPAR
jgi:hypothetical protein